MENALGDDRISAKLLERARELYDAVSKELAAGLSGVAAGSDPDAKSRAETIRAHRKALQAVLDIETQLMRDAEREGKLRMIDVEAAKREIYRRLDIEPSET